MNNIPQRGICYADSVLEVKEEPTLTSKCLKTFKPNDAIKYERVIENEFGKWIMVLDEDNYEKRYILIENTKKSRLVKFPALKEGIYAIINLQKKQAFTSINSIISLSDIDLNDNQKFFFKHLPKENLYKITCISSGKELAVDTTNSRYTIIEKNKGNGIKWSVKAASDREFELKDFFRFRYSTSSWLGFVCKELFLI